MYTQAFYLPPPMSIDRAFYDDFFVTYAYLCEAETEIDKGGFRNNVGGGRVTKLCLCTSLQNDPSPQVIHLPNKKSIFKF